MRCTCNKGLNKTNAKETKEVNERSNERENSGEFGESNNVERGRATDLVTPAMKKVISNREEKGEENAVG